MMVYGHGWGMMAGMLLFWALVIGAGLWLLARLFPAARCPEAENDCAEAGTADPAVRLVRQRYASGEISKSEYTDVLQTLGRTISDAGDRPQAV